MSRKLNLIGINTALDLAESSLWVIKEHFNVVLERTVRKLRGEPCLELQEFSSTKQQIICSRSFGNRVTQYSDMHQAICAHAKRAAEKLRSEHQSCRFVNVFVRTSPHAVNEAYYDNQASMKLLTPSNDTRDIVDCATSCLRRIQIDGYRYMKVGVILTNFFGNGIAQLNLFDDNTPCKNSAALMDVIDQLNRSGKGKVWFAGRGIKKSWAMKREILSPAYTTRYSDLPVAKWVYAVNDIASGEGHYVYQVYAISGNAFTARRSPPLVSEACLAASGRGAAFVHSPSTARGCG